MRFFLRSRRFKIICGVVALLLVLSIILRIVGGSISPQSSIIGAISQPFRSLASYISNEISDFNMKLDSGTELMQENQQLQNKIDELSSQVVDYTEIKKENEFLKGFLEIKEKNKDYTFEKATLISRDNDDVGLSFTINKGYVNGVSVHDPVMPFNTESDSVGGCVEICKTFYEIVKDVKDIDFTTLKDFIKLQ